MLHYTMAKMGLLLGLLLFTHSLTVSPNPADVTTTCSAPPAYFGEQGSVTCYFQADVNAKKFSFSVRRAGHIDFDYNRDTVLDCDWIGGEQLCVTIKEGFVYDYQVTSHLTIVIPNVTLKHQGLYSCKLFHQAPGNIQSCYLTVLEREEPNVNSSEGVTHEKTEQPSTYEPQTEAVIQEAGINILHIIVPTVIGAVLVFAAAVVVYMFKRKDVEDSDPEASENGGEGINDKSRMLENPIPADETPDENPTPADETPPTLTNRSEGHYEALVTFEVANEPSSRPLDTCPKGKKKKSDDYATVDMKKKREDRAKANKKKKQEDKANKKKKQEDKANKKKKKAKTADERHEPETDQDQERQLLTDDQRVDSTGSKTPNDIEEEAADAISDDPWGENGDKYGREREDDDDARHSDTEGRQYTEKDMDISDDERLQRGDAPEKVEHKKMFKQVVKDLDAHFATGSDILHPASDEYKGHVTA